MNIENSALTKNLPQDKGLFEKEKRRLEVITSIADSFVNITSDYKEMIEFSAIKLAELTNDLVLIGLLSGDGKKIDVTASYHSDEIVRNEFHDLIKSFPINIKGGVFGEVIETGLPLIISVDGQDLNSLGLLTGEYNTFFDKYSFSSLLSLPLYINKKIIGTLSFFRIRSGVSFTADEQDFLQSIAGFLASIIRNSQIYNEKELLLREMHHRIKNNLQVISSLLSIQSDYVSDEKSHKLFINSLNRIRTMSMVYDNLNKGHEFSEVDINRYLRDLIISLYRIYNINTNHVKLNINIGISSLPVDTSITCGLIINDLISNSLKHAFPDGRSGNISLSLVKFPKQIKLVISDDGVGFPEKMNFESNYTFGLLLVNTLVDQLNGTMKLIRTKGARFIIKFPNKSA
jgi:two-component sensor histidine kinase